jgi:hypothetical protein
MTSIVEMIKYTRKLIMSCPDQKFRSKKSQNTTKQSNEKHL